MAAAFNQIRQCAQKTPSVSIRMLETLAQVGRCVTEDGRRAVVRAQADMVLHGALSEGLQECDRQDLDARYRAVIDVLERSRVERHARVMSHTGLLQNRAIARRLDP